MLDRVIDPRLTIYLIMDNGSSHTSREDLMAQIDDFAIRHNATARPYRWRYDARMEHDRYLVRHSD
jgi:hypothetical protein